MNKLGWLPDVPSVKDYTPDSAEVVSAFRAVKPPGRAPLPPPSCAVFEDSMPPVRNQGELGSCVAYAITTNATYMQKQAFGKSIELSPLFLYKAGRRMLGWKGDTGLYIRTGLGALAIFGAPPEPYWPYKEADFEKEPDWFASSIAQQFQATKYFRLDYDSDPNALLTRIKQHLASGIPLAFGFPVYDEFMRNDVFEKVVKMPRSGSKEYGGHAVSACGYDDTIKALRIHNSWGKGWGLDGYCWLSYDYVLEGLAVDWWAIIKQEWLDTGAFSYA